MKRKILALMLFVCMAFVNGCSCDKFDINTYETAVKNYNNSTGIEYKLTISTFVEGESSYSLEESINKYRFNSSKKVENYSSELKISIVAINDFSGNSAPTKVYELKRYYIGDDVTFYSYEKEFNDARSDSFNKTYEEMYDMNSRYNVNNLVPMFSSETISDFKIEKDEENKKNSIATFKAACPTTEMCTVDTIEYKVYLDRDFNFKKIEFTTINENTTKNYVYEFYNFNSEVKITFPQDLVN